DQFDGSWPFHAEPLLQKAEHISALVADEAVVHPLPRGDGEVAVRPLMKRTRSAEVGARPFEVHVLADDLDDIGGVADLVDDLVGYHLSSPPVTPAPPSFQAPRRKFVTRDSLRSISETRSRNAPVPLPWMMRMDLRSARMAASTACITMSSISPTRIPRRSISLGEWPSRRSPRIAPAAYV